MKKIVFLSSISFCLILIVLSIFFDLSFSKLIFIGENFFSTFFQILSEDLLYFLVSLCFLIFFEVRKNKNEPKQLVFKSLLIMVAFLFLFLIFFNIYSATWYLFLSIASTFVLISIELHFISKINDNLLNKLNDFAVKFIKFVIVIFGLYFLVSFLWGRIRFKDLLASNNLESFMSFWEIDLFSGHKSFYSGHTTTACALIPFIYLSHSLIQNKNLKLIISIFIPVFIFIVGFSRVVCGAHFISDVAFSILISILVFYLIFEARKYSLHKNSK